MYALFLPSAQSFISSVEENVNVEERIISVTIGPLTPRRFGSPPWMAFVCGPSFRADLFFIMDTILAAVLLQASTKLADCLVPQTNDVQEVAPHFETRFFLRKSTDRFLCEGQRAGPALAGVRLLFCK